MHYIDVSPDLKRASIHSQIFEVSLINAESLARGYRNHLYGQRHPLAELLVTSRDVDDSPSYIYQILTPPAIGAVLF